MTPLHYLTWRAVGLACLCLIHTVLAQTAPYVLPPSVALEAEEFVIDRGWQVVQWDHGNYMVDIIGFNHGSGERLLGTDETSGEAMAHKEITVPVAGTYRLWVRYEYPALPMLALKLKSSKAA